MFMTQAAHVPVSSRSLRPRQSRAELLDLARTSGAIERFTAIMGGPPEFDGCDDEDLRAFVRENAP